MSVILFGRTQLAIQTPFDNSTNGFIASEVQSAIEEAQSNPAARVSIVTTFNGSIGNNQWLGYNELLPGNQVPIRLPFNCELREISFSYNGLSVDGVFDIYKNGILPGDINYTNTFTNQDNGKTVSGLSIPFLAGDFFSGRWVDTGTNPSDLAIVYFFVLG